MANEETEKILGYSAVASLMLTRLLSELVTAADNSKSKEVKDFVFENVVMKMLEIESAMKLIMGPEEYAKVFGK